MATRDPQATREQILQAAFRTVHEQGLGAASLDAVLARAGVTKGALYHHFDCKKALGCALVDEVLSARIFELWVEPLRGEDDPVPRLQRVLREVGDRTGDEAARLGCPLNNLAQEVSAADDDLRARVEAVYRRWAGGIAEALDRGKRAGTVRREVDAGRAALFIVGAIEGAIGLAKTARDPAVLRAGLAELSAYLGGLQARGADRLAPARRSRR